VEGPVPYIIFAVVEMIIANVIEFLNHVVAAVGTMWLQLLADGE
jgi:hypothetical protein